MVPAELQPNNIPLNEKSPKKTPFWRSIWLALTICLTLLGILVIPAVQQYVQHLDYAAAYFFNSFIGKSPVFDRLVLFIGDDEGRERLVAGIVIWFIIILWMTPGKRHRARLLGTVLFCLTIVGIFLFIDAQTNDVITRRSPSYKLVPFNSLKTIYNWQVDISDKRSYPNSEAMVFLIFGFILLRLRQKKHGIVLIFAGLTIPLGRCIVGSTWVTDIYLGSLPVAFLASAIAVETPLFQLRKRYVKLSDTFFDQLEKLMVNWRGILKHRKKFWTTQNVFYVESTVKHFVRTDLPLLLPKQDDTSPTTPKMIVPLGGLRSVIRIIDLGDQTVILRAYPASRFHEADQHRQAADTLVSHGVRVPKILNYVNESKKNGMIFIIEEFIQGRCIAPESLTDQHLDAAAEQLARLHSVKNIEWGPLTIPRGEKYSNVLIRRAERQLNALSKNSSVHNRTELIPKAIKWFRGWEHELKLNFPFALVHGKLHRENCLFENTGRFCIIDNTTMEWGVPALDLVTIHQSLCGNIPEVIERFDSLYYSKLSDHDAVHTKNIVPLFYGLYYLAQTIKYTKRINTPRRGKPGGPQRRIAEFSKALNDLIEQYPSEKKN